MISITRWIQLAMALYGKQKVLLVGPAPSGQQLAGVSGLFS